MKYTLLDAVKHNQEHPTFEIPNDSQRGSVRPGDIVKLVFEEDDKNTERMWVLVTEVNREGYVGTLDNEPFNLTSIKFEDEVKFTERNIINIY